MRAAGFIALLASLTACADDPVPANSRLSVSLPRSVRQGLASSDAALCNQLDVRLTFDATNDLAPPAIDGRRLEPKADAVCVFVLGETVNLPAGTYDLIVRFDTQAAPGTCSAPLLVGAYVVRDLEFPFPEGFEGLSEADFYSRPGDESALELPGLSFDPDEDGRDNLSEVGQGSDPCRISSLPITSLQTTTTTQAEGSPIRFVLRSSDEDGIAHRVRLSLGHSHGPNLGTERIELVAFTDGRSPPVRSPLNIPALETWQFVVSADQDPNPGAAEWTIDFVPDEPFIGPLTIRYSADDGQNTVLFPEATASVEVINVDDPTILLFEEAGTEAPRTSLVYPEEGNAPVEHVFRFEDADLGADVSTWTAVLGANPSGVALRRDAARWVLSWVPTNAQVVSPPVGGHRVVIEFFDGPSRQGMTELSLQISPLYNDPISLIDPQVGELALPAVDFPEHRIHFAVLDPDELASSPSCQVSLTAAVGTSCDPNTEFTNLRCETDGLRQGQRWPMVVVLTPAATFRAACGANPNFDLAYTVTDVAPPTATNGPQSALSSTFVVRTANVVQGASVDPGAVGPPSYRAPRPAVISGAAMKALVSVEDPDNNYERDVYVVDLSFPTPSFSFKFPRATLCELKNDAPEHIAAVDEAGRRVLALGRTQSGTYCNSGVAGAYLVDLQTNAATHYTGTQLCGVPFQREGRPVVDRSGNFYVPCYDSASSLARIDAAGALQRFTFTGLNHNNPITPHKAGLVYSPTDVPWLVWPSPTGLVLVNLSTLGQPTPTVQTFTMDADWFRGDIDGFVIDEARHAYVFAYNRYNADAELWRVSLSTEAPVLEGPLALGDIGGNLSNATSFMRPVLRDPSSVSPPSGADLLVRPGSSGAARPLVDLDTFSVAFTRPASDFFGANVVGSFSSPDRRFSAVPVSGGPTTRGIYLYPWDHAQPRQFVNLPVPTGTFDDPRMVQVSDRGNVMVVSESTLISVIYFVDAMLGLD